MSANTLYYGDNLDILREHVLSESVDLIYLDPPFNSARSHNLLFKDESGRHSDAQIKAFDDTWHWGETAERTFDYLVTEGTPEVSAAINSLMTIIRRNQMMAYLVMMTARLVELHRVLKPTGSLYLHCDPTASHYLKIILDTIFGTQNFRNEIIWQRTAAKSLATRRLPDNHDVILCYQKTEQAVWNAEAVRIAYDPDNLSEKTASKYRHKDSDGRLYRLDNLVNPNPDRPNLTYEFLGVTRVWRWTKERMQKAYEDGLVIQTKQGTVPQLKRYLDEQEGRPFGDVWTDIAPLNSQAKERLGYPTQKPVALLERIIALSSNPGDVVLDPFCGCGTAIAAAHILKRRWIGIDITHLSTATLKYRLMGMFGIVEKKDYQVVGEPQDLGAAQQLARDDRYQFQWWALSLIKAKPLGGVIGDKKGKKGADSGIDGVIDFLEGQYFYGKKSVQEKVAQRILVQVKSGKVGVRDIRDFRGVLDSEKAAMGIFITLEKPTDEMEKAAGALGFYESKNIDIKFPRLQICTIADLLGDKFPKLPPTVGITFKQAQKVKGQLDDETLKSTQNMFEDES